MANERTGVQESIDERVNQTRLTWKDKLEKGLPLNPLEEVQADADFNYHERLRQEKSRQEFEQRKARAQTSATESRKGE
jgi:hypothetical protein